MSQAGSVAGAGGLASGSGLDLAPQASSDCPCSGSHSEMLGEGMKASHAS